MLKSAIIVATTLLIANISAAPSLYEEPDYEHFESKIYPSYGVRFVRPQLCDPNITQYAGYLDMGAHHYHFWFFESEEDSNEKPLTSFFNGGPGCTSQVGIWTENSPCAYSRGKNPKIGYREQNWTKFSNMLFIDQPSGTGFSYGDYSGTVNEAAVVFYEAIQLFYEAFPKYSKLPYHLFGESYGGRMSIVFGNYIAEQNLKLRESRVESNNTLISRQIIPLESVGSMSPWMNPLIQYESSLKACDFTYGSVFAPDVCKEMRENYRSCKEMTLRCYSTGISKECFDAREYCGGRVVHFYSLTGRHPLDMRKNFSEITPPEDWVPIVHRPDVRKSIGAIPTQFKVCSEDTKDAMARNGEFSVDTTPVFNSLINHGIKVLVTSGDADFIGNWVGVQESLLNLNFNGSNSFNAKELKPWFVDHKEVGQVKSTDKLTFVRMYEAGHELPFDQPENSLIMFGNWINKKDFLDK